MRAITYQGPGAVRCEPVPDPRLVDDGDAILRVELTAICGSDLHVWHGRERGLDPGTVMGHECLGEVVAVGPAVRTLRVADRAVCPFTTSCGECWYCLSGLTARCERGQLFGWVEQGRGLHGVQAELVRVPLADGTLVPVTRDLPAEAALLLADVLPTGWHGARLAETGPGRVTVVLGCGPVGLMAVLAALEQGADTVLAVDAVPERLALAQRFGARPVRLDGDVSAAVRGATGGRGADGVVEAVGSASAGRLAFDLVRPGGTIATVGVHHEAVMPFTPAEAYDRNLTWRIGRCPARHYAPGLVPVALRRAKDLTALFTHRLPLEAAADAYRMFDEKRDGCIKVALVP
jgi:threonine dehydrogenase-like Zn-dependent dehydrogenase